MTNKELIEKLQKLPQDAEIWGVTPTGEHVRMYAAYSEKDENAVIIETE